METILIIDDVATDRELLGSVVAKAGHHPVYAGDGSEGLALAKTKNPALIFLDVVMPVQDGFKTCRALKNDPATARIPVVLVTSKNTDSDRFWGKKQGADDLIGKPYSPDAMLGIIRRYVR
jgi:twitching motility two-component system response regulator PilH